MEILEFYKRDCPKKSGIYALYNKKSKKIYFGKSANIRARLSYHRTKLEKNDHPNQELQKDYNDAIRDDKYCMIGCMVQLVPADQIDKAELTHITYFESYRPDVGYNTQLPKKNQD